MIQRELFFVHISKNAGTSIVSACEHLLVKPPQRKNCILTSSGYLSTFGKRYLDGFKFAVCRHPLDRFVSAFYYIKAYEGRRKDIFWDMAWNVPADMVHALGSQVKNKATFRPHSHWLDGPDMDRIIRFEDLDVEWPKMVEEFGVLPLQRHKQGKHRTWQEELPLDVVEILRDAYADDFKQFGYE